MLTKVGRPDQRITCRTGVHFIGVGTAPTVLVHLPDGSTVLEDLGESPTRAAYSRPRRDAHRHLLEASRQPDGSCMATQVMVSAMVLDASELARFPAELGPLTLQPAP